ncbi:transporter substrate-binding domain-containing protein [Paenibacillus sp. IB182496]|uniref:Transporter substrate-binding domain-containing protein n=1 Tax=Paenibacillus sabuli TaxID=2772509 RepID=A0A927BQV9_9BACL|nr:transporter substrate-binding domain-containing protein [Paenibacillus sabuli]MBD2844266.1 transporter substrate-binding domain-containing protein [Paenibacillus sabuli]
MKKIGCLSVLAGLLAVTTACGGEEPAETDAGTQTGTGSETSTESKAGSGAASGSENDRASAPEQIIVGTGTQFPKVAFLDEDGTLTGFDVELVREIDERLDEYEFELRTFEFTNLLLSLETEKIDFAAHQFEKNEERQAKYLFNKEPYAHWKNFIIVDQNNDSIQTLDDLQGKKVLTSATSAQAQILENYNAEHDAKIDIVYNNGGANDTVSQITTGRVDATLAADFTLPLIDPNGKLKTTGEALSSADILFLFRKDDPASQKLADAIDEALVAIKEDGTLSELSTTWLGDDFTK